MGTCCFLINIYCKRFKTMIGYDYKRKEVLLWLLKKHLQTM